MSNAIYLGTIDAGGDGLQLLLAAINHKLGTTYTMNDFDFGVPMPVDIPTPTHNTKIKFGPKLSVGFYGVRTIYYSRIHASELGQVIVPYDGEGYLVQLLPKINEKYGILIKDTDVVDTAITPPPVGETSVAVTLTFVPTSVVFYSSTQIQVGLNDPTGDTAPIIPFETHATFAFDQSQQFDLLGTSYAVMEPFSLALSRDNSTIRLSSLTAAMQGTNALAHARIRLEKSVYEARRSNLPFVGQWMDQSTGQAYGMTVLGDVYRLAANGYDWTFATNALNLTHTTSSIAAAYANPMVKLAVQAANGDVYILAKKSTEVPAIWKMTAGSMTWTKMPFSATRMQCLTAAQWNELQVMDALHSNNRLWVLIRTNTQYATHPNKSRATPAVEVYNTNTNATDYFPLGTTAMRYNGITMDTTKGKWRLVTPPTGEAISHCDVVALLPSTVSNNTYAVMYRYQATGEYTGYILPNSLLPTGDAARAEMDVAAYQIELTTTQASLGGNIVSGHFLDVVSILSPVEVSDFNRYFLRTGNRAPQKYLAYGLRTLTSIAVRSGRTPWRETQLSLPSSNKPTLVTLFGAGKRNHVIFQNGTAVHRQLFSQINGKAEFEAMLDSTSVLESHTGFDGVSSVGAAVYAKPGMSEFATPIAELATIQDDESVLPPIGFSFIARNTAQESAWFTAQNDTDLLTNRSPSLNYAFMGKVPALVISEAERILYWSREGNGLFISDNRGGSWQEFNSAPYFYRQERAASSALNVLGSAVLRLTTDNFGEAAFVGSQLLIDIKCDEPVKVYDANAGGVNTDRVLHDQILFETKIGTTGNAYVASHPQSGFGMNTLSQHSPRRLLAWDSDAEGNFETVGQYSSSATASYDLEWRLTDYMLNTPGKLMDFSRDVKYLGVRHWFLVEHDGVWNLHFTDAVQPTRTIGLLGVEDSPYNTFLPEVNFHLWDHVDDNASYAPYVFYGNKRILLLERIDVNNNFAVTHHVLSIPGDNGNALTPVKMYTANRRDYWFHQKGNGLFKLAYAWDGINEVSSVTLLKMFDTSTQALSDYTVHSGSIVGIAARNAPQETVLPDKLPLDYFIGQHCQGTTMMRRYADGEGGWYEIPEPKHVDCGWVINSDLGPTEGTAGGGSE